MSSNNSILIALQAVNKTTNVFNKVSAQMNKVSNLSVTLNNSISNIFYGIGAWKLFSNSLRVAKDFISQTTQEFANLADSAALAGESSPSNLYAFTKSLDLLDIKNVSIDTLTKSMSRMTKATGEIGVEGFIKTLASISQIENEQQRLNETMRIFDKEAGTSFNVITRGGIRSVIVTF